ncbi:alpha/beta fold hydrolase [Pseudomonas sp. NFXW11]|uniref:alpha/beta fold hydrolase n=1 Tax=Pseudomonas sp. NFXW11 TaxID=2819531 RepID=UPI003CF35B02
MIDPTLPPTLVLLPGMDGTGHLFDPLCKALKPHMPLQVVAYPDDQFLDYPALLQRVWPQLPKDRPFVLLGESFSGPLAVAIAAQRPAGLLGLVLCASFVCNPRPALAGLSPLLPLVPLQHLPFWPLDALLLGGFSSATLRTALAGAIAQVKPKVLRARLQAVIRVDQREALRTVEVPLLYLRARRDRLVPPAASALIRQERADLQLVEIDAPHCLLQAAAAEAGEHLLEFIRAVSGEPTSLERASS